jgi:hypothetical protein
VIGRWQDFDSHMCCVGFGVVVGSPEGERLATGCGFDIWNNQRA